MSRVVSASDRCDHSVIVTPCAGTPPVWRGVDQRFETPHRCISGATRLFHGWQEMSEIDHAPGVACHGCRQYCNHPKNDDRARVPTFWRKPEYLRCKSKLAGDKSFYCLGVVLQQFTRPGAARHQEAPPRNSRQRPRAILRFFVPHRRRRGCLPRPEAHRACPVQQSGPRRRCFISLQRTPSPRAINPRIGHSPRLPLGMVVEADALPGPLHCAPGSARTAPSHPRTDLRENFGKF